MEKKMTKKVRFWKKKSLGSDADAEIGPWFQFPNRNLVSVSHYFTSIVYSLHTEEEGINDSFNRF